MRQKLVFLAFFLAVLLFGCASIGHMIDQSAADRIKKGETTKGQVIDLIGSPTQVTRLSNGDTTFVYLYVRVASKPESFIPIVGLFAGGSNVQNQIVVVTFGPDDIVKTITSTYGATESNMGVTVGGKPEMPEMKDNSKSDVQESINP